MTSALGFRPARPGPAPAPDPMIGALVGGYRLTGLLGEGGTSVVYEAEHPAIGKRVAIKVLRPGLAQDPVQVRRVLDEARAVSAIGHPGIVDLYGFGELEDGLPFIVMQLLVGDTLLQLVNREGPLSCAEAVRILDQITSALEAAHELGIAHRDLKPENVFLEVQSDGRRRVKLLDFGIAKQTDPALAGKTRTVAGKMVGTVGYASPEQLLGRPAGLEADLYALGCLGFAMLTGAPPFVAADEGELIHRHLSEPPPRPSSLVRFVPAPLDELLLALLAKKPSARPTLGQARAVLAGLSGDRSERPGQGGARVVMAGLLLGSLAAIAVRVLLGG